MARKKRITISQYFDLRKSQFDLDFCDTYIHHDTRLFIDPWAIRCAEDDFSVSAYQKLQSAFERLIHFIHEGKEDEALEFLDNLHEPRETGLGYTKSGKDGSSVGREKSEKIYQALKRSKAVQTNNLHDIEDTALHIEGIANDNISDIVTNIIRYDLILYTQEQAELYGLDKYMIETQTKPYWSEKHQDFIQTKERMLIAEGKKILLVPKHILRRNISVNYRDFYNKGVLEFEQARHYNARTSLCKTLQGKVVGPPTKEKLREQKAYHLSRELVFDYIDKHPELLTKYKGKKSTEKGLPVSNEDILEKQGRPTALAAEVEEKIRKFKKLKPGKADAHKYHDHIMACLNTIFNEPGSPNYLSAPKKNDYMNNGRKIIDIKYQNSSTTGFFSRLNNYGGLFCGKIIFECKNYKGDPGNPEFDQLNGRFNNRESTFGYIVCRDIEDRERMVALAHDYVIARPSYMCVLTDDYIIELLKATLEENRDLLIDQILQKKLDEIL